MSTAEPQTPPFGTRATVIVIAAAVLAFAAFLLLLAFGGDFRSGHDARAHALSVSADGYAGLVELTDDLGSHALLVRDPASLDTRALLIVTPQPGFDGDALPRLLARRDGAPTLVVLPKWATQPLRTHSGWAEGTGLIPKGLIETAIAKAAPDARLERGPFAGATPDSSVPRLLPQGEGPPDQRQRLTGGGLTPLLVDGDGKIVLARLTGKPVYILAEPDLLNNRGLADEATARRGWAIVDRLSTTNEVAFDLTLDGFATQRSTMKLLFQPPFLPATLCIAVAALFAGLHGAVRFGAAEPPARAIAFGKRMLVDNAAQLFRAARKEHRAGAAYATLTRDLTAQASGAPSWATGEVLDGLLDRAAPDAGDPPFATLAWHAATAENREQLVAAAQALYCWRRNRTR